MRNLRWIQLYSSLYRVTIFTRIPCTPSVATVLPVPYYVSMLSKKLSEGTVHKLPADFRKAIQSDKKLLALWEDITPLARNEWICWVTSGAKAETRVKRIKVGMSKMRAGERRPCCWVGCLHRDDKPMNSTQKWLLGRKAKAR